MVVRTTGGAALVPGRQAAGAVDLAITVGLVDHVLELLVVGVLAQLLVAEGLSRPPGRSSP